MKHADRYINMENITFTLSHSSERKEASFRRFYKEAPIEYVCAINQMLDDIRFVKQLLDRGVLPPETAEELPKPIKAKRTEKYIEVFKKFGVHIDGGTFLARTLDVTFERFPKLTLPDSTTIILPAGSYIP